MVVKPAKIAVILVILVFLLMAACSKQSETPFDYPFVQKLQIKRVQNEPYSDYKAFYVLTEDFEPQVETVSDIDSMREVLRFALDLSLQHKIPWTHFIDVNSLSAAFTSGDEQVKQKCLDMISDLKLMVASGDDCQLHLHGTLNRKLLDFLKEQEKLRAKSLKVETFEGYRQNRSFYFNSVYTQGYRDMVTSLSYGKRLLEKSVYDNNKEVIAFRAGGWDHGSSSQDTFLYFSALIDSGLKINSGLTTGEVGAQEWRVGHDPGQNLAAVTIGENAITEISPTARPRGYVNPVLPVDLEKLANSVNDEMAVIVSVYHLNALQTVSSSDERSQPQQEIQKQREELSRHFQIVSDLASRKILYPITMRELSEIINRQR
jgi:hypothetical protein